MIQAVYHNNNALTMVLQGYVSIAEGFAAASFRIHDGRLNFVPVQIRGDAADVTLQILVTDHIEVIPADDVCFTATTSFLCDSWVWFAFCKPPDATTCAGFLDGTGIVW
jgi:hypothetical protein